MRVGFTLDFRNPLKRPWRELWEDNLWLMCEAEAMGFDSLLVQEHFFTSDGYGPSVPVFLSQLATRTKSARISSYIYILPLHNPFQLAQETLVLDQLSNGRLDVMVGAGHSAKEYQALGYDIKTRPSRMEEGLSALKRAWAERPLTFHGRYFNVDELSIYPEPVQRPHPPLWVGTTSVPAARRAARHGAHLASGSVDPAIFRAYLDELAAVGIDRSGMQISKSWSFTTTYEDPEAVWRRNRELYIERWGFYSRIRKEIGDAELKLGTDAGRDQYRENELIGDPEAILGSLRKSLETLPLTMVIHNLAAGIPLRTEAYQSIKLFADKVLPEIKRW